MELDVFKVLRIALPTLFLFYSLSWSSLSDPRRHREVFGNGDVYLDLVYPSGKSRHFTGTVLFKDSEQTISGRQWSAQTKTLYTFETAQGRFTGELRPSQSGCEPSLHYRIVKGTAEVTSGVLKAGFCSETVAAISLF